VVRLVGGLSSLAGGCQKCAATIALVQITPAAIRQSNRIGHIVPG
jgi:hypothetical protein